MVQLPQAWGLNIDGESYILLQEYELVSFLLLKMDRDKGHLLCYLSSLVRDAGNHLFLGRHHSGGQS
ncbi:hypothetical protein D479_19114 [Halobacillus sp. BAB-2008]|nr:hypothetical protein D479_19114 [Halobacillus sp. BAB-2008]